MLHAIIADLRKIAEDNEERAFRILGARPGPGLDLLIRPEYPLCGQWYIDGLTPAGKGFVGKFWVFQPLSNQKIAEARKQAIDWGLKFETKYPLEAIDD